jgi:hypothetical protein
MVVVFERFFQTGRLLKFLSKNDCFWDGKFFDKKSLNWFLMVKTHRNSLLFFEKYSKFTKGH